MERPRPLAVLKERLAKLQSERTRRAHGEYVERSEELEPAMKRALESGKPAVVNVIADCDGVEYSQAWLRLKSGDMYSRGLEAIGENVRRHFALTPLNALRLRKTAEDNGTRIPLSFIAKLTGNGEAELRRIAQERHYHLGED